MPFSHSYTHGGQNLESANKHLVHDSTSSLLLMGCENSAGMQARQSRLPLAAGLGDTLSGKPGPGNVARIIPHSYRGKNEDDGPDDFDDYSGLSGRLAVQCRAGFPHHGSAGSP
jgi:hypothetical protein